MGFRFSAVSLLFGSLFSNATDNTSRTELIILLTLHVIKNEKDAVAITSDYMNRLKSTNQLIKEKSGNDEGFVQPEKRK